MILGFSHVSLNAREWDRATSAVRRAGYHASFLARNVPNPPEKAPVLSAYHPRHDLAMYTHEAGGVAVELVSHGPQGPEESGPYHVDLADATYIALRAPDMEAERSFWGDALGFRRGEGDDLVMTRPIRGWSCRVRLVADSRVVPVWLDATGSACIAFIVSNLTEQMERVVAAGAWGATKPFAMTPNGQPLRIALFRTPSGAICEFIQPVRP